MKTIFILNKKEGETPLAALSRFRARHKEYEKVKMTYAGRLDPLVSGLLLVVAGDTVHEKEKYLGLTKEYAFEILFGFATDTHDILGTVTDCKTVQNIRATDIKNALRFFKGTFEQEYPLYSSPNIARTLRGLPVCPRVHAVTVRQLAFLKLRRVSGKTLLQKIERRIDKVEGNFRQKQILQIWRTYLKNEKESMFLIASLYVKCGSGMYVRRLAHDLGQRLGIPALAWKITRTKIGKFAKM